MQQEFASMCPATYLIVIYYRWLRLFCKAPPLEKRVFKHITQGKIILSLYWRYLSCYPLAEQSIFCSMSFLQLWEFKKKNRADTLAYKKRTFNNSIQRCFFLSSCLSTLSCFLNKTYIFYTTKYTVCIVLQPFLLSPKHCNSFLPFHEACITLSSTVLPPCVPHSLLFFLTLPMVLISAPKGPIQSPILPTPFCASCSSPTYCCSCCNPTGTATTMAHGSTQSEKSLQQKG